MNRLVSVEDIADLLGVSKYTVYRKAEAGLIPCYRIGRKLRFDTAAVLAALESRPAMPAEIKLAPRDLLRRTKPKKRNTMTQPLGG